MAKFQSLAALPYVGGKSAIKQRVGRWVTSLLPPVEADQLYVEPFAGMLGVLLQRPRAAAEVVNDKDELVWRWWKTVRDEPEALAERLECTPYARNSVTEAATILAASGSYSDVEVAAALAVVLRLTRIASPRDARSGSFSMRPPMKAKVKKGPVVRMAGWDSRSAIVLELRERLRDVVLENREALEVIETYASVENAVLYLDPPYADAGPGLYFEQCNLDPILAALASDTVMARVAISGYESCPWDALGWNKHHLEVTASIEGHRRRKECLWTNYETGQKALFGE